MDDKAHDTQDALVTNFVTDGFLDSDGVAEFTTLLAKTLGASAKALEMTGFTPEQQAGVLVAALNSVGKVMPHLHAPLNAMMLKALTLNGTAQ